MLLSSQVARILSSPTILGVPNSIVVDAHSKVLQGAAEVGNKVVVIGGGEVGIETAYLLSERGWKKGYVGGDTTLYRRTDGKGIL